MAEWLQVDVFRLIDAFKEQRLLWDPVHGDHKNRNKKHDAWVTLDRKFKVESGEYVRRK